MDSSSCVALMLAKRIIPSLLVKGRTIYKGEKFNCWRSIGHALQGAQVHARRGVDELLVLDVAATAEGRGPDLNMVRELSEGCFTPITVGGGVRTLCDINALLRAGADKVAIGTGWVEVPNLIRDAAARFGRQAIVASLDVSQGTVVCRNGQMMPGWNPYSKAEWLDAQGAGEILLSNVDRDGTMQGYDLDLIRKVSAAVSVPVIASGGCRDYDDMLAAFKAGADACAAGALFSFTDATPKGAAKHLKAAGLEVRL